MSDRAPSSFQLTDAMGILMRAREFLQADPELANDEQLLADFMESDPETCDAFEQLHRLARAAIAVEDMGKMARARGAEIIARARRFDAREEYLRAQLKSAMQALGAKRIQQPDFTATIGKGKAAVVIVDDTTIPDEFVKTERTPRKREIGEALDAGIDVPGAVRGNAEPQLTIRRG